MSKKLLTIFGATGNQGGSVINAILSSTQLSTKYSLRAITRDTTKPNAQALASKGVDLAQADLNNADSIASAIQGSYGVFAVTDYWATTSKDIEYAQGKNIVDACVAQGVKHLVWSSLPNVTRMTDGVLSGVEHFDSKAAVAEYAEKVKGAAGLRVSNFMPGFFMSNLLGMIKAQPDGTVGLAQPWNGETTWIPMLDIRVDTGKFVAGLWEKGADADGVYVQGVSQWMHPRQLTDAVAKTTGKDVKFIELDMSVEKAKTMERIPREMTENMLLIREYSYFGNGAQEKQAESDAFLLEGATKVKYEEWVQGQKWNV
jgi:uncharacterized protein YbjT (DUF2867 family)